MNAASVGILVEGEEKEKRFASQKTTPEVVDR